MTALFKYFWGKMNGGGQYQYDLYPSPNKKNDFVRLEVWKNAQALQDHKATLYQSVFRQTPKAKLDP